MTKYKLYRISGTGQVTVEIVEALDWMSLFNLYQYNGNPIIKIEIIGATEEIDA